MGLPHTLELLYTLGMTNNLLMGILHTLGTQNYFGDATYSGDTLGTQDCFGDAAYPGDARYPGDDRYVLHTTAASHKPTFVLTFIRLFIKNGLFAQMKATFEA